MAARKDASAKAPARASPRPGSCGRYAMRRLAENLPAIADTFVEQAKGGSVPHTKMLVQMTGLNRTATTRRTRKPVAPQGPTLTELLLGELQDQAAQQARPAANDNAHTNAEAGEQGRPDGSGR